MFNSVLFKCLRSSKQIVRMKMFVFDAFQLFTLLPQEWLSFY